MQEEHWQPQSHKSSGMTATHWVYCSVVLCSIVLLFSRGLSMRHPGCYSRTEAQRWQPPTESIVLLFWCSIVLLSIVLLFSRGQCGRDTRCYSRSEVERWQPPTESIVLVLLFFRGLSRWHASSHSCSEVKGWEPPTESIVLFFWFYCSLLFSRGLSGRHPRCNSRTEVKRWQPPTESEVSGAHLPPYTGSNSGSTVLSQVWALRLVHTQTRQHLPNHRCFIRWAILLLY